MSLSETSKLLVESQKIMEQSKENDNNTYMLNLILKMVTDVDNRSKAIEEKLSKLDKVETELRSLTLRLGPLERSVKEIETKNKEIETSIIAMSELFDETKVKCDTQKSQVEAIEKACVTNKSEVDKLKSDFEQNYVDMSQSKELEEMRNDILDLKCRSMKNNLIFTGLKYSQNENCEEKLRSFLYHELGIEHKIELGNVHRIKGRSHNGGRPIVARFIFRKNLELVISKGYLLRNTPFGIKEQFPEVIEKRRQKLYPVMKDAKRQKRQVELVRDTLYIDGERYVPESADGETREVERSANVRTERRSYRDTLTTPIEARHRNRDTLNTPPGYERQSLKRPRFGSTPEHH